MSNVIEKKLNDLINIRKNKRRKKETEKQRQEIIDRMNNDIEMLSKSQLGDIKESISEKL